MDEADRHLSAALRLHERLASPTLIARTLFDRARLLGDADAARRCDGIAEACELDGLRSDQHPPR
jgi:hypothetical protein